MLSTAQFARYSIENRIRFRCAEYLSYFVHRYPSIWIHLIIFIILFHFHIYIFPFSSPQLLSPALACAYVRVHVVPLLICFNFMLMLQYAPFESCICIFMYTIQYNTIDTHTYGMPLSFSMIWMARVCVCE